MSNIPSNFEIVLDISRLLSRAGHATPTGVDRCEMAYAQCLLAAIPEQLEFGAVNALGIYGRLPRRAVERFLHRTELRWSERGFSSRWDRRRAVVSTFIRLRPGLFGDRRRPGGLKRFYVLASPNNLTRPALIRRILARERAQFICLVHDLIPLEYPEYARPDGSAKHDARMRTASEQASGIVFNSHATMQSFCSWIDPNRPRPEMIVSHLGTKLVPDITVTRNDDRPFFVCVGTIEPRKNHLLLLNLWRRMAEKRGARTIPRLILVGRRGWENEQVVDMLERCHALQDCVAEVAGLPDSEVHKLMAASRGLLMPSFAEGYGMPVTEAIALKVPVVCSDLPALREAGGSIPEFLDPLDGPAWQAVIDDLTDPNSAIAARQEERRANWRPPSWPDHIAFLLELLHRTAS